MSLAVKKWGWGRCWGPQSDQWSYVSFNQLLVSVLSKIFPIPEHSKSWRSFGYPPLNKHPMPQSWISKCKILGHCRGCRIDKLGLCLWLPGPGPGYTGLCNSSAGRRSFLTLTLRGGRKLTKLYLSNWVYCREIILHPPLPPAGAVPHFTAYYRWIGCLPGGGGVAD